MPAETISMLSAIAMKTGRPVAMKKIAAITMDPARPDLERARGNLALVVAAAAGVGAQVCVEFLPWSGIPDLATAWELVEPLGAGAGILLDTWHWVRQPGGPNPELLARIPGERIGYVQLCDAALDAGDDIMAEAMGQRLLPGDGEFDIAAGDYDPELGRELVLAHAVDDRRFKPRHVVVNVAWRETARRPREGCAHLLDQLAHVVLDERRRRHG